MKKNSDDSTQYCVECKRRITDQYVPGICSPACYESSCQKIIKRHYEEQKRQEEFRKQILELVGK